MFQKLYRHLEEANATLRRQEDVLRRQEDALNRQESALSRQEGALNRQEGALNANTSNTRDIVRQLELMNDSVRANQRFLEQTPRIIEQNPKRVTPIVPAILFVALLVSLGIIVFLNIRLSRLTKDIASGQLKEVMGRQQDLAVQLVRLDSVMSQQGQCLVQLKDLNEVSAHSFVQIKNKIDRTNRLIKLLRTDSSQPLSTLFQSNYKTLFESYNLKTPLKVLPPDSHLPLSGREGLIDGRTGLGEPAGPAFRHVSTVFQSHAKLAVDGDHRLDAETHSGL